MKRKVVLSVLSIHFVCGLVVLTLYLSFPNLFAIDNSESDQSQTELKTYTYRVNTGAITHTSSINGAVVSNAPELYILSYEIEGITDENFELLKKKGEEFSVDDELYKSNNKTKTAEFNGKVVDIDYFTLDKKTNISISVLNYDALFIVGQVDQQIYNQINYDTVATITFDGTEYNATITDIGYEVSNGYIQILLSAPMRILPGSAVKITFVLDVVETGMYVPSSAVYNNNGSYYAFIKDGDGKKQVELTVGEMFTVEEDGTTFEYIEILSGVTKSDVLIVEETLAYSIKLNEALTDE